MLAKSKRNSEILQYIFIIPFLGDIMVEKNNHFFVLVEGLNLDADIEQRICAELRNTAMKELAKIDTKGDLVIRDLPEQQELRRLINESIAQRGGGGGGGPGGGGGGGYIKQKEL